MDKRFSHVVVGGGLAGALTALALAERGRGRRVALVEVGTRPGGDHTWSFHETDVTPAAAALIAPLVTHRWASHEVRFRDGDRVLAGGYASISSRRFAAVVHERLTRAGATLALGCGAAHVGGQEVVLADGRTLRGEIVLDARGPAAAGPCGWQKFLGLEVELGEDPPFSRPVLMDATVAQRDGYRFMYALPLGARRILVEDTYYSDAPDLDAETLRVRVLAYLAAHGLHVARVQREERGALPLPFAPPPPPSEDGPIPIGYRGGWLHPTTGYSLPVAARVALAIAGAPDRAALGRALGALRRRLGPQARFFRMLNRLLFRSIAPEARWGVFARFYRLPEALIARFYAMETTAADRARLLCGRPPQGLRLPRRAAAEVAR